MQRHRRLLVATDFSDTGDRAVQASARMARGLGAEVTLFHLLHGDAALFPDPETDALSQVREHLKQVGGDYFGDDETVHVDADVHDSAVIGIVEACQDFDLCVVGTHGRTGVTRLLIGSVAEGVVRQAPCDVLTIPALFDAETNPVVRGIVAATDLSEPALRATRAARRWMEAFDVPLFLLHVVKPDVPALPTWNAKPEDDDAIVARSQAALDKLAEDELGGDARIHCEALVAKEPSTAIVDRAAELGADLLVLGSHGRTGIERLLIGSVAERSVRHAKCAVLVVR